MRIYIICPVRKQSKNQKINIEKYVKEQEEKGNFIFYPKRDAPQEDKTGYNIVKSEIDAIRQCDEVHIFWDIKSSGSHFDLGAAIALNKKLVLIHEFVKDGDKKSYAKVIKYMTTNNNNL
jgi:nucleoside 2-deoxyribosyltransferase